MPRRTLRHSGAFDLARRRGVERLSSVHPAAEPRRAEIPVVLRRRGNGVAFGEVGIGASAACKAKARKALLPSRAPGATRHAASGRATGV